MAVGSLATIFLHTWGKNTQNNRRREKDREEQGSVARGADIKQRLAFCLRLSRGLCSVCWMVCVAHGSQMGRSFKVPAVYQLLNVITCTDRWVRWCPVLIKSGKRGGEGGTVIEGTSLILADISLLDQWDKLCGASKRFRNQNRFQLPRTADAQGDCLWQLVMTVITKEAIFNVDFSGSVMTCGSSVFCCG